jgi:uncharacterized protein YkwD
MDAVATFTPARTAMLPVAIVVLAFVWMTTSNAHAASQRVDRLLAPKAVCPAPADTSTTAQVAVMACLVGYARSHAGVPPLRESKALDLAGTLKLNAEIRCGAFTHTPCGQPLQSVFDAAGYSVGTASSVAENLALGQGDLASPQAIMQAWLGSPDHRQILLSTEWTSFGLAFHESATFLGAGGVALWANEFAGP